VIEPAPVATPTAGDDAALPDGFSPLPAAPTGAAPVSPAAVLPAPAPAADPAPVGSGQSALDVVTQGLNSRPAEEPTAAAPEPPATQPAKSETPRPSEPKTESKPKTEPKPKAEPPKVEEPAQTPPPADNGGFEIKIKSKESYKIN